ncbi:MAG: M20/M25/M40 family metallo-hydrolase [Chloroflexi bacterium]|nr:M20/M25/M40 family metallo-hydrolase [Chloroflexota bacterium]
MTINSNSLQTETTQYLQDLIRIDTTNPPGNETRAAEYLAAIFKREGIEPTILESAPGRGNLVARLKGDGRAAPLLLMVHLDVVTAEPEHWSHPPFGGEIADGYIWGRGALDTKELAVMELIAMLQLKREGKPLARDIIFMANADEETGGKLGAGWMVKEHPDLIRAEYAINEGGGFGFDVLGHRFYTVQTGEKGTARFTIRARGKPGHGSQPHRDNAVLKLADAIKKIGAAELPLHVTPTVKFFIEGIAAKLGKPVALALNALLDPKKHRATLEHLPLDEGMRAMLYAMLHNTVTPTMLKAGTKINVIPSLAEGQCDARLIPGQTSDHLRRELDPILGNAVEIEFMDGTTGRESNHKTTLFETITRVMARYEPKATVLPYLVVGATDAKHIGKLGTHVYGFSPMFMPTSELGRVHAHDERISIENLMFGTRVLYDVISEFCANGK